MTWPPLYQVKKHRRAKCVKLRIVPNKGLMITTPYRFNIKNIPSILEAHQTWIIKQLQALPVVPKTTLPELISMPAMAQTWKINYESSNTLFTLIERPFCELTLLGPLTAVEACLNKLTSWIKKQANCYLSHRLNELSQQFGLPYQKLLIRNQKTRWGSCTKEKVISLNYKLLFLPPALVDYVLIHELCHTQQLNHSVRFWQLVEKFDPNWRMNRIELRKANKYIPVWCL